MTERKNTGKEEEEGFSDLKITAGAAPQPIDPWKVVFDAGVRLLMRAGKSEPQARTIIGKWRRDYAGRVGDLITAISEAERLSVTEPVSWITATMGGRGASRNAPVWDEEASNQRQARLMAKYGGKPNGQTTSA